MENNVSYGTNIEQQKVYIFYLAHGIAPTTVNTEILAVGRKTAKLKTANIIVSAQLAYSIRGIL